MCESVVLEDPLALEDVIDQNKMQQMCERIVERLRYALQYTNDWFDKTKKLDQLGADLSFGEHKTQKIELYNKWLPIAWHPYQYRNWCVPKDKKN